MRKHCDDCPALSPVKPSKYYETYVKLAATRMVFLSEDITKEVAAQLSAMLLYYDNLDQEEDIELYIHSNGGDASALINIYDVMQIIKAPIKTICLGKAYSAAAVLLAAGTKGKRFVLPHSSIMLHGIQCGFPIIGHDQIDSKSYFEFLKSNEDGILKIVSKHTGVPFNKIKEDCNRDMYFDAQQSIKYGIADKILV